MRCKIFLIVSILVIINLFSYQVIEPAHCGLIQVFQGMDSLSKLRYINYGAKTYTPHPKDYPVDIFFDGIPSKPYEVIGGLVGEIKDEENIKPMLEKKTRQVGGDGLIGIETNVISKDDYTVVTIKAKVIKYKDSTKP